MITAPSKEDIKRNEENWKKIHQILREDAINKLKNNEVLIPANKRLLELLIAQKEFVGNISTWMPSRNAKEDLARLGLIEDAFVIGGFREWFADEVKRLILDDEISNVIKLFKHIDPAILGDLAGLSDKEYAFVQVGANWIVKFKSKTITLHHNNRLYYLAGLLDKPAREIYYLDLERLVRNQKYNPAGKIKKDIRAEELKKSLSQASVEELKNIQIMEILGDAQSVDNQYYPDSRDVHYSKNPYGEDDEKKAINRISKNISNVLKDIAEHHRALYLHLKICVTASKYSVYQPELDPSIEKVEPWHIRF